MAQNAQYSIVMMDLREVQPGVFEIDLSEVADTDEALRAVEAELDAVDTATADEKANAANDKENNEKSLGSA